MKLYTVKAVSSIKANSKREAIAIFLKTLKGHYGTVTPFEVALDGEPTNTEYIDLKGFI